LREGARPPVLRVRAVLRRGRPRHPRLPRRGRPGGRRRGGDGPVAPACGGGGAARRAGVGGRLPRRGGPRDRRGRRAVGERFQTAAAAAHDRAGAAGNGREPGMTSRIDAPLKVTGRARYALDHTFPGMLHGYVVTSTVASGEVVAMDVTAAKRAPGVVAVYSPFDPLPLRRPYNPILGETWVPLQDRDVTHHGQPVGFVVAENFEQARDAARLVEVTYDERPARTSLLDHLDLAQDAPPSLDGTPSTHTVLAPGVDSIEEALAASPVVADATYSTAAQNHAAMEPRSAVAVWDDDGLTIYSGNQGASFHQADMAAALGVEPSSVHTINPFVGGAFGGKGSTSVPALLAAAAARALGRPVKAAVTREQVFTATANRAETLQAVTLGADRDGTLIAVRHDSWCSAATDLSFVEQTSHAT